jgi:GNAT superfamily N-acetyltransferase
MKTKKKRKPHANGKKSLSAVQLSNCGDLIVGSKDSPSPFASDFDGINVTFLETPQIKINSKIEPPPAPVGNPNQINVVSRNRTVQQMFDDALRVHNGKNWANYLTDRQNAIYTIIPSHDSYVGFIERYKERLSMLFRQYAVETDHDYFQLALCDPEIYSPETSSRRRARVCVSSDNETFTLIDGKNHVAYITFRPFGSNTVELSRMLVLPNYQKRGIGTALVKLCQDVVKECNARLALHPAPPLAAQVDDKKAESHRLRKWYGKLGFVDFLPEILNGFRLINNEPIVFGWCGLMVFK